MGNSEHVSAVVVTFHPSAQDLLNIAAFHAQVDLLIVVDNGSSESDLAQIRLSSQKAGFVLIENGENLGVAAALNLGVQEALKQGCEWIALFDQDSVITDGFIALMIEEFQAYRQQKQIMQMIPRYRDPESGLEGSISAFGDGGAFLTITSGSLFSREAFARCGLFREDLFVYGVDDDYSLRIRRKGFFIGVSRNAVLLHESGHPTSRRFFGKTLTTKNYRPESRYYYARNKVWILRNYGKTFPRIIIPTLREFLTIPLKVALMEKAPGKKIEMFVRGLLDGVAGRMGRLDKYKKAT
jgi:rhamnosyltransferase